MQSKAVKAVVMCDPERIPDKASQTKKVHTEGDLETPSKKIYYSFHLERNSDICLLNPLL